MPGSQMSSMMGIPPPPPRYLAATGTNLGVVIPPPPGPPPGSALGQQAPWHGGFGRLYDGRPNFAIPQSTQQHQPYNPKLHAQMAAGQNLGIPPPPPPNNGISATYIPSGGDTYGEGVGIPGFGPEESALIQNSQPPWPVQTPHTGTDTNTTTPMDDVNARDRLYLTAAAQGRASSNASNPTASSIPPEIAAQWSIDTVLLWLARHQFSKDWQDTFRALNLHGSQFLELGSGHGGRGNLGMMHQHVYPRLAQECASSGTGWDASREREEGKRMRRLIRSIVTGRPVEAPKFLNSHARKESSGQSSHFTSLPSAGTDPAESPNVSYASKLARQYYFANLWAR